MVNGGGGLRVAGLVSTDWTVNLPASTVGLGAVGVAFVADRQPVELLALPLGQPRLERRAVMLEGRGDRPIFLRAERLDLALALDDQAQRTDWTRPADLAPGSLRHSTGDSVNPTR